jgi:integrase
LAGKIIYIPVAKAGAREQPITSQLVEFLKEYLNGCSPDQEWLFPSKTSASGHYEAIERPFRKVVKAAGMDPYQVLRHTLRHTAISHLVQAGVDLPTVKRISGHKTIQMVERYSHQDSKHIQAAMNKLEGQYRQSTSHFGNHPR